MENQRILVIGGTGFIGAPLVKKMIDNNFNVTLLIKRDAFGNKFIDCKYFIGDLLDKNGLMRTINNFDLVINLASVIRTINKKKYKENIDGARNLVEVLGEKGIKRLIYFSTQSVSLKEKGPYGKGKEAAERIIKDSNLNYLIIRPNYVYGIDMASDFYKLALLIFKLHIAPIIGNGNYKIQPVLRDDLVDATFSFVKNFSFRSIVEVSGRETLSINKVVNLIGENLEIKPFVFHIPISILKIFKNFIPFDIAGYTEDRISKNPFPNHNFSLFSDNLKKILKLLK